MSYQTGVAADPNDLINILIAFLTGAGWTIDSNALQLSGRICYLTKGSKHIALRSTLTSEGFNNYNGSNPAGNGIAILGGSSPFVLPTPVENWWQVAGAPHNLNSAVTDTSPVIMDLPATAITYWMFADPSGDNFICVALRAPGIYNHLFAGDVVKADNWTGGFYFGASNGRSGSHASQLFAPPPPGGVWGFSPNVFVRADVDSWVGKWLTLSNDAGTGKRMASTTMALTGNSVDPSQDDPGPTMVRWGTLRTKALSTLTGGLILLPTMWFAERDLGSLLSGGGWSLLGTMPWVYQATTDNFAAGSTYTISTDEYVVFPSYVIRKFA